MYTVHPGRAINWPLAACRRTSHAIHRLTCVHNGQFGTMPCLGRRTLLAPTHHSTAQCATCAALSCTLGHPTWQLMGWYSTLPATTSTRRHLPPSSGLQRIALHTAAPAAQHAGLHNDQRGHSHMCLWCVHICGFGTHLAGILDTCDALHPQRSTQTTPARHMRSHGTHQ